MNKTALRKILAEEGLLPQKKVASKDIARMFIDFYKRAEKAMYPHLEFPSDPRLVRLAVSGFMTQLADSIGRPYEKGSLDYTMQQKNIGDDYFVYSRWFQDYDVELEELEYADSGLPYDATDFKDEEKGQDLIDDWENKFYDFMDGVYRSDAFAKMVIKKAFPKRDWDPKRGDELYGLLSDNSMEDKMWEMGESSWSDVIVDSDNSTNFEHDVDVWDVGPIDVIKNTDPLREFIVRVYITVNDKARASLDPDPLAGFEPPY